MRGFRVAWMAMCLSSCLLADWPGEPPGGTVVDSGLVDTSTDTGVGSDAVCGDGVTESPEECDLGSGNNTAVYGDTTGCTADCTLPGYCGDGVRASP